MAAWSPLALALLGVWLAGMFAAGLCAQAYRYRRVSSTSEKQQTKVSKPDRSLDSAHYQSTSE